MGDSVLDVVQLLSDSVRLLRGSLGELADLVRHDGESLSGLARMGRLNSGVHRKQVRLFGYALDYRIRIHHGAGLVRDFLYQSVHGRVLLDSGLSVRLKDIEFIRHLHHGSVHGLDVSYHLLDGRGSLDDARSLGLNHIVKGIYVACYLCDRRGRALKVLGLASDLPVHLTDIVGHLGDSSRRGLNLVGKGTADIRKICLGSLDRGHDCPEFSYEAVHQYHKGSDLVIPLDCKIRGTGTEVVHNPVHLLQPAKYVRQRKDKEYIDDYAHHHAEDDYYRLGFPHRVIYLAVRNNERHSPVRVRNRGAEHVDLLAVNDRAGISASAAADYSAYRRI